MSGHVSGLSFCLFSPEKRRHRVLSLNRMIWRVTTGEWSTTAFR
jgi:hypothetical protein